MVQRVATVVGSGGKGIIYYNFGPNYMFPGNCWSANTSALAVEISDAHALLAKAERLLWEGVRPAASVAILAPRSATPWDDLCSLYDDTCIFGKRGNRSRENLGASGKCCFTPSNIMDSTNVDQTIRTVDYLAEVYGVYHALAQVHNTPTTWIDETAVVSNASAMQALSTLVMTEPNIPAATVAPILDWVHAGGNLVVVCAAGVLDEYNQPAPLLWQGLRLLKGGAGSTSPEDFSKWAPASRMNVHVAGELIIVANGTGSTPELTDLTVAAYGRRCVSGLPPIAANEDSTVLATFSDGTAAVSSTTVGHGSVVYFSWLPGVSHVAAMEPSSRLPVPRAPDLISDASKWLAAAVSLARNPTAPTAAAAANAPLVETPLLLSTYGAVVTVLDWRPHDATWKQTLVLNVTLPFAPQSVESALHGELHWAPIVPARGGGFYGGLVQVEAPPSAHGADFISFHRPNAGGGGCCRCWQGMKCSALVCSHHAYQPTDIMSMSCL
jgi:hypothetical protein